jgi:seryl-tRNA synthetase
MSTQVATAPQSAPKQESSSASLSASPSQPGQLDVQRIIAQYKAMRAQITELANKLSEVDSDRQEHQLVIRAIEKLDVSCIFNQEIAFYHHQLRNKSSFALLHHLWQIDFSSILN